MWPINPKKTWSVPLDAYTAALRKLWESFANGPKFFRSDSKTYETLNKLKKLFVHQKIIWTRITQFLKSVVENKKKTNSMNFKIQKKSKVREISCQNPEKIQIDL